MRWVWLYTCLWISGCATLQQYIPRDSSYTIQTSYDKLIKNYPQISIHWVSDEGLQIDQNIEYIQIGDRSLFLDVFRQRGKEQLPLVLLIHGGGWMSGVKENMHPLAMDLAQAGYVTVVMEYRLSREATFPAAVRDINTAIAFMVRHADRWFVDDARIAVMGCSAGAHLASLVTMAQGEELFRPHEYSDVSIDIDAVLNIDGIVSFVHPEAAPEWIGRSANAWLGAYDSYETWEAASPLAYDTLRPFLFVNSAFPRFHAGRDELIVRLDDEGIYHDTVEHADAPHCFWFFDPWYDATLAQSLNFLNKTLK